MSKVKKENKAPKLKLQKRKEDIHPSKMGTRSHLISFMFFCFGSLGLIMAGTYLCFTEFYVAGIVLICISALAIVGAVLAILMLEHFLIIGIGFVVMFSYILVAYYSHSFVFMALMAYFSVFPALGILFSRDYKRALATAYKAEDEGDHLTALRHYKQARSYGDLMRYAKAFSSNGYYLDAIDLYMDMGKNLSAIRLKKNLGSKMAKGKDVMRFAYFKKQSNIIGQVKIAKKKPMFRFLAKIWNRPLVKMFMQLYAMTKGLSAFVVRGAIGFWAKSILFMIVAFIFLILYLLINLLWPGVNEGDFRWYEWIPYALWLVAFWASFVTFFIALLYLLMGGAFLRGHRWVYIVSWIATILEIPGIIVHFVSGSLTIITFITGVFHVLQEIDHFRDLLHHDTREYFGFYHQKYYYSDIKEYIGKDYEKWVEHISKD